MKKTILASMLVAFSVGIMAFAGSNRNSELKVHTVGHEYTLTHDCEAHSHLENDGFGRCLKSGCYCKEFEGRGQTCRNCGHAYSKHY